MTAAPEGLQLDLLTIIVRLEQIADEFERLSDDDGNPAASTMFLLEDRVIKCDVPRLRSYLTPETLAWAAENDDHYG